VRVPGPPPHGDRPGAPGAGVRSRSHHDGARRQLQVTTTSGEVLQIVNPNTLPQPNTSSGSRSPTSRRRSSPATTRSAACSSSARTAGASRNRSSTSRATASS
jgi:hypothetical protein